MSRPQVWSWLFAIATASLGTSAHAATVTVLDTAAIPGWTSEHVGIVLTASPAETVAAMQFDVLYNPSSVVFDIGVAGSAASAADKTVSATLVEPGRVRVLISGFNLAGIAGGTVAGLYMGLRDGVAGSEEPLTLSGVVLSDPLGNSLPVTGVSGNLVVDPQPVPAGRAVPAAIAIALAYLGLAWASRKRVETCR